MEPPNIDPIDLFAVATNLVLTGIKADKKYYEHKTMYLKISDCQLGNRMRLGMGTGKDVLNIYSRTLITQTRTKFPLP